MFLLPLPKKSSGKNHCTAHAPWYSLTWVHLGWSRPNAPSQSVNADRWGGCTIQKAWLVTRLGRVQWIRLQTRWYRFCYTLLYATLLLLMHSRRITQKSWVINRSQTLTLGTAVPWYMRSWLPHPSRPIFFEFISALALPGVDRLPVARQSYKNVYCSLSVELDGLQAIFLPSLLWLSILSLLSLLSLLILSILSILRT